MEDLNNVPSTGTFGNSINLVNQNFGLVKGAIENVEGRTIRSKGLFPTQAALTAAYPSPKVGDYAYVGSGLPATIYDCLVEGTWHNTGQTGGSETINLGAYSTTAQMNTAIDNGLQGQVGYAVCNSNGSDRKDVVVNGFKLLASGGALHIKMTNVNTAANATMNISPTPTVVAANTKPLFYNGAQASSENTWGANEIISVYYDGTNYQATNSQGGGGKAEKIKYDNSQSGLAADNVQGAIDILNSGLKYKTFKPFTDNIRNDRGSATVTDDNWMLSGYIEIPTGTTSVVYNSGLVTTNGACIVEYNSSRSQITWYACNAKDRTIRLNSNTKYVRAAFYKPNLTNAYIKINGEILYPYTRTLKDEIIEETSEITDQKISEESEKLKEEMELIGSDYDVTLISSDVTWNDGLQIIADSSNSNYGNTGSCSFETASGFISCKKCSKLVITIYRDNQPQKGIVFYNESKQPIKGYTWGNYSSTSIVSVTYDIPEDAYYFRTTFSASSKSSWRAILTHADNIGIKSEPDNTADLSFSDTNDNNAFLIIGGHIITKNFNSQKTTRKLEEIDGRNDCIRGELFALNFSKTSELNLSSWTNEGTYLSNSASIGSSNPITMSKSYAMTDNRLIVDFSLADGGVAFMGIGNTMCKVDLVNSLFVVFSAGSTTSASGSAQINGNYYEKALRVEIIVKTDWKIKANLYNVLNGDIIASINEGTERGRLKGSLKVYSTDAEMRIYDIRIETSISQNGCLLYATGDSITEGYRMIESQNYIHRFASLFESGRVKCSGNSGCNIFDVQKRLFSEAAILRPKYIMVMIGTNGNNTTWELKKMINMILSYGSIPIINHIPAMANGSSAASENSVIDSVIAEYKDKGIKVLSVKCNIAVCEDNDPTKGLDSALAIDGAHPNAAGHQKMFQRMKIDVPELFNYINL